MTRDGIKKCIKELQLSYQNVYNKFSVDDMKMLIEVWELQFRDFDDVEVFSALNECISTSEYPPTIATIKRCAIREPETNEEEVWDTLLCAGRNGLYGSYEEWERLPEDLKAITTPETIKEIALADDEALRYIKHDILGNFRSHQKRSSDLRLTSNVRKYLFAKENRLGIEGPFTVDDISGEDE